MPEQTSSLTGKTALITGASTGIGFGIAESLKRAGAKLILVSRNEEKLLAAKMKLGDDVEYHCCDVSKLDQLDRLYQKLDQQQIKLDVLVANAGIQWNRHLRDITEDNFDEVSNTNYKGVFFTVQKALPCLNSGASIILISSIAAHNGYAGNSVYAATKAAVSQMAKNFAADLVEEGIRVNAISPGCVVTPIWDKVIKEIPNIIDERSRALIPAKRFAAPSEVGELALYLASSASSYVNGQDFVIDGGETALSL